MGDRTEIAWADATWNPVRGCTRVSEGCRNCYAETVAARFSGPGQPYEGVARYVGGDARWTGDIRFVDSVLTLPVRWTKPRRIFVNSMSDLFHSGVTDEMRALIFLTMAMAPQHQFLVLTKRPEAMRDWVARDLLNATMAPGTPWPLPNVWLGVSVEDQAAADARVPLLLQTPARVRFVSAEPLLGPVDLRPWLPVEDDGCMECEGEGYQPCKFGDLPREQQCPRNFSVYEADIGPIGADGLPEWAGLDRKTLDWVIVGGESGGGYREMPVRAFRQLFEQCKVAGVPFFAKQDSAFRSGQQGRIPNEMWVQEWPDTAAR